MQKTCPKCKRRIRIRKNKREVKCICGHEFSHNKCFGPGNEMYLIDANIFLYALNGDKYCGRYCNETIMHGGPSVATTKQVMQEIRQQNKFPVKVFDVKKISPEVDELHYDTAEDLSLADKSLIQCAIDHPEIIGIISYDADIKNVVPTQLIKSEKKFFVGNAQEFLKKTNQLTDDDIVRNSHGTRKRKR
jgi:predicted nucleic acid-binding protein